MDIALLTKKMKLKRTVRLKDTRFYACLKTRVSVGLKSIVSITGSVNINMIADISIIQSVKGYIDHFE